MYASHNVIYNRYGAFALKAAYQRNLIQSQMIVVGTMLFGIAIATLWPRDRIVAITPPPIPRDSVIVTIEQQLPIKRSGPETTQPLPEDIRRGIPEPVPEDLEGDYMIPTTDELYVIVGAGDSIKQDGMVVDTGASDLIDGPGVFRKLEIDPELIDDVTAEYPQLAQRAGIEGHVSLYGLVSENGDIIEVRMARSSGSPSLDQSASDALKRSKWKPGIQNGKPVKCWVTKTYKFEID